MEEKLVLTFPQPFDTSPSKTFTRKHGCGKKFEPTRCVLRDVMFVYEQYFCKHVYCMSFHDKCKPVKSRWKKLLHGVHVDLPPVRSLENSASYVKRA